MRAAKLKERPGFSLMKQTDIQNIYYMQMPRWLFSDPRYADMSLDAKVAYTFLLNRFQLSRRKGWVNDQGEVFVIFPRLALAKELRVCEKRVTAAFRTLAERRLIWEKRCGRGDANQIYLARVEPVDDPDYQCAPFLMDEGKKSGFRTADMAGLEEVPDVTAHDPTISAITAAGTAVLPGAVCADNAVPLLRSRPCSRDKALLSISKSCLPASIPARIETSPLKGDNVKNIP